MKLLNMAILVWSILSAAVIAWCGSSVPLNKEASTSAIYAAEHVSASNVPTASSYLQIAKEELENTKGLAENGDNLSGIFISLG